ncbi:hypothetical protein ScPMuIL_014997 [Solemya velum]
MTDFDHIAESMLIQLWERVRFINEGTKLQLAPSDIIVLRLSWTSFVAGDLANRGFECFLRMFKNHPKTQEMFEFARGTDSAQMQNSSRLLFHVTRVMKYIGKVVENLDSLEDVVPMLRQLGGRHGTAGYNVPPEYFPFFGEAMRQLMKEGSKNFDDKKEKLWTELYTFIIDQLKVGQKEYGSTKKVTTA